MPSPTSTRTQLDPDTILERYGERIYRIARSMSNSDVDAEDVMQSALLKILLRREQYRGESSPMGWIYRITMNDAREVHRARSRRAAVSLDDMAFVAEADARPSPRPRGPQAAAVRSETERLVRDAVHALRPAYREAVVLRDLAGLSYREAAASMRLTLAGFKTRLHRARMLLRESLSRTQEMALSR